MTSAAERKENERGEKGRGSKGNQNESVSNDNQNDNQIQLSDYLKSAFSVLHESLLKSLEWEKNPCRLFILINSRLFSPNLRFFLTDAQKDYYRKKYDDPGELTEKQDTERRRAEEAIKYERTLREAEAKSIDDKYDADIACDIMRETEQSGTVSSLFKQRGFYELFLEEETFAHPVLLKEDLLQSDCTQYSYPKKLEDIERYFLLTLPNVEQNSLQKNGQAGEAAYQFAMIPYFFRGHPFGCIAFFNPNPKLRKKREWYDFLNKVLNILDEKEGTIYQAAIKDLCQKIFEAVEEFKKDHVRSKIFSDLNDMIEKGLLSGHIFLGAKDDKIKDQIEIFYHGKIVSTLEICPKCKGKEQDLLLKLNADGKKVIKTIRIWTIYDKENEKTREIESENFDGYLACIDPKELYTSWEKQFDLQILETVEMALLAYNRKIKILKQGIRAAVAAIMSRNMSHNIGSHVLAYLVDEYGLPANSPLQIQLNRILEDHIVRPVVNLVLLYKDKNKKNDEIMRSIPSLMPDKKRVEKFIQNNRFLLKYLKDRMDFIATVLTYVPSCTTMNFATDFIGWDDINNDIFKVWDAINFDTVGSESIYESKQQNDFFFRNLNLLLNYICASEKIGENGADIGRDRIVIFFKPYISPIPTAIPGGTIGRQAFLTIIENIVRNCAKHGARSLVGQHFLRFTIEFPDQTINGTESISVDHQKLGYDRNDFLRVTISDNVGNASDGVLEKLRSGLEEPIVNLKGQLERENLGLKEMKVAAAFLRGIDPRDIAGNEIIGPSEGFANKLITVEKDNQNFSLVFSFFLLKPKQILIVKGRRNSLLIQNNFREYGIDMIEEGADEYDNLVENHKIQKLRYRFILYCSNEDTRELEDDFLPRRKVFCSCDDIEKISEPSQLLQWVYKEWLGKHYKLESLPVIYLQKEKIGKWNQMEGVQPMPAWEDMDTHAPKIISVPHFEKVYFPKLKAIIEGDRNFLKERKILSVDSVTGSNSSKQRLENPVDAGLLRLELIEAALTKVLIIDERLYKAACRRPPMVLDLKGIDVWDLRHIESRRCMIYFKTLSSNSDMEIQLLSSDAIYAECEARYDFLSIHQGIIDKIVKKICDDIKQSEEQCMEKVFGNFRNLAHFSIIHSGRGNTELVPQGWRFMGYSELENWFMSYDKYEIVQGLYSVVGR